MKSHVRIFVIIAVSIAVPSIAIWQRWSEVRVFARQLSGEVETSPDAVAANSAITHTGSVLSGATNKAVKSEPLTPQETVEHALVASSSPSESGKKLLEALPTLPDNTKVEAVQHLTNLVADDDYAPLSQILANPETSEDVMDLLMVDIINRRNDIKLPALLEVARTPNHARASEAKALLMPYLEGDYGNDWTKCQTRLNQFLKEHPDS